MLDQYLELCSKGGLTDALLTDMPFEDCLSEFPDAPCWIMPLGNQKASVSELLKSERFGKILEQCREELIMFLLIPPTDSTARHYEHVGTACRSHFISSPGFIHD